MECGEFYDVMSCFLASVLRMHCSVRGLDVDFGVDSLQDMLIEYNCF